MTQLSPYLHFDGTCREAMTFYQSCFGGELRLMTVGESPMAARMPAKQHERILHASLKADSVSIMASGRGTRSRSRSRARAGRRSKPSSRSSPQAARSGTR
jgi:uncharacterized glyoxalase superfamily protein PhnB